MQSDIVDNDDPYDSARQHKPISLDSDKDLDTDSEHDGKGETVSRFFNFIGMANLKSLTSDFTINLNNIDVSSFPRCARCFKTERKCDGNRRAHNQMFSGRVLHFP